MRLGAPMVVLGAALLAMPGAPALARRTTPPEAIASYENEPIAPGVWRLLDDGAGAPLNGYMREIRIGPGGSVWILAMDGAFELGEGGVGPAGREVDRLFAVGADGQAWLRDQRGGSVLHEGFGTWDGRTWADRSGLPRHSALERDPDRAPRVIRDLALGSDGAAWVVAGEQDGPRWERFTVERLDEDGWTTWAIGEGLPSLPCSKNCGDGSRVLAADDGSVWVSVDQGGLLRFDGRRWEPVRPLGDDTDHPVLTLVGDRAGFMWAEIATGTGGAAGVTRVRFDGSGWEALAHAQDDVEGPLDDERCRRLGSPCGLPWLTPGAVGPDGTLWLVGAPAAGQPVLWAIDGRSRRVVPDLGSCDVRGCWAIDSLAVASDGLVWVLASPSPGLRREPREGALLVIDPEAALQGDEPGA